MSSRRCRFQLAPGKTACQKNLHMVHAEFLFVRLELAVVSKEVCSGITKGTRKSQSVRALVIWRYSHRLQSPVGSGVNGCQVTGARSGRSTGRPRGYAWFFLEVNGSRIFPRYYFLSPIRDKITELLVCAWMIYPILEAGWVKQIGIRQSTPWYSIYPHWLSKNLGCLFSSQPRTWMTQFFKAAGKKKLTPFH